MIKTSTPNPPKSERRLGHAATESRQVLLEFRLNTPDPVWSSRALEEYVQGIARADADSFENVFVPLSKLLAEAHVALSETVGHFVKDLVTLSVMQYRSIYDATDWSSFITSLGQEPTAAQCYLALFALPAEKMARPLEDQIIAKLGDTPFAATAKAELGRSA